MSKTTEPQRPDDSVPELLRFELESSSSNVMRGCEAIRRHCQANHIDESTIQDVMLIFEETASNVVNHAYRESAGTIQVTLRLSPLTVELELRDHGPAFDPTAAPDLELEKREFDECQVGGFGIHLVRRLSDSIEYSREGSENRLRIVRRLNRPAKH